MEVSMSEIIRETRNAINSRLDMLEVLVSNKRIHTNNNDNNKFESMTTQFSERIENVESTLYRFNDLVSNVIDKIHKMEQQRPIIPVLKTPSHDEVIPELNITDKPIISVRSHHDDDNEDTHVEKTFAIPENKKELIVEEIDYCDECGGECDGVHVNSDKVKEEEAEEEQLEEEEAEEELELEEFEYKGMTLYRDSENKVYQMDEDGALSDPIGIWDESKNRIKKIV